MPVSSTSRKAGPFLGNGVTTSFPFTFKVFSASDVAVYHTDAAGVQTLLATGYTVAINANQDVSPGGSVTYPSAGSPMAADESLDVIGAQAYLQGADIRNGGAFQPSVIQRALDYLAILCQQLLEKVNRALAYRPGDTGSTTLPSQDERAGKVFTWDDDGDPAVSEDNFASLAAAAAGSASAAAASAAGSANSERQAAAIVLGNFLQDGAGAVPRTFADKARDALSVKDFGAKGDGTTDDTAAIQAAADTGKNVYFPPGDYRISSAITASKTSQKFFGSGHAASYVAGGSTTQIRATADIEYFRASAPRVVFQDILFETPTVAHTKPHLRFVNGADYGEVLFCRVNGSGSDGGSAPGITFDNGAGGLGTAVIGRVTDTYVVHATINVRIHDVKVTGGYVWTLSKQWGIGVFNGVSNFVADTVDIVPPFSTVTGLKAGIYVSGASANPSLVNCYLDGNFSLNTGKGALFENGCLAPSVIGGKANGCDDDVITFDSVILPTIKGMTFFNNNRQGNGAADIVLKASFAQLLEKPLVEGTMHLQSAAVVGTPGPAVKLVAGVTRRGVRIHDVSIHQPGAGGGYSDVEILLEDGAFASDNDGTLRGCRGTRTLYAQSANAAYLATDLTKTVSWPATMAYAPRIDQVRVIVSNSVGIGATPVRVQSASTGNTVVGFVSEWLENSGAGVWHVGAPSAGTLYLAAEL